MKKKIKKGIDWSKKDMYEGIGRPDLRPKNWCCPYCDFKVPSWLFHKKQSLARHLVAKHRKEFDTYYKNNFTRKELELAVKEERERVLSEVKNELTSEGGGVDALYKYLGFKVCGRPETPSPIKKGKKTK